MASTYALMKRGVSQMDLSTGMAGVAGVAVETAAGFGASYALGQVYARYRDRKAGKYAPLITAVVGKASAIAANVFMHESAAHWTSGVLDAIGQAGVNAVGLEMGIKHGMKAKKRQVVVLPEGVESTTVPGADRLAGDFIGDDMIGALPAAAPGKSLSFAQIEELASMH